MFKIEILKSYWDLCFNLLSLSVFYGAMLHFVKKVSFIWVRVKFVQYESK
jgi:hypothetical protein